MRIGIIGGTGREGRGLSLRWALAGHRIALGSREAGRARERAVELSALLPASASGAIVGGDNPWAVRDSDLSVLCVPYPAHATTLQSLRGCLMGRILIDITVPLRPPHLHEVHLPPGQSAAMEAQALLGPDTKVVATLHHVSSSHLAHPDVAIDGDILVCADDVAAREVVLELVGQLGVRAIDAGPLRNAIALESLAPVLLHINRRYKGAKAGVRITGLP